MRRSSADGARALASRLKAIVPGLRKPIASASGSALSPTLAAARALAPVEDGDLRASLAIMVRADGAAVGVRADYVGKEGARPYLYARGAEFGRVAGRGGRGSMPATRFLTRAFDATAREVLRRFGVDIGAAIETRAASLGAKR